MDNLTIPAREGRAFQVEKDQSVRIVTPHGKQAADFYQYGRDAGRHIKLAAHSGETRRLRYAVDPNGPCLFRIVVPF